MIRGKIKFLGTGGSCGVPVIGCSCSVCHSKDAMNQRLRPSVLLRLNDRLFLVDAGPDLRTQALRYGISYLDGVLLTHAHHDHTAGLDDLRPIYYKRQSPIPILLSSETAREVGQRYDYLLGQHENVESRFVMQTLPNMHGEVIFEGLSFGYVSYHQGGMQVNGFRIGDFAYISDIRDFSPEVFSHLKGIKYLIVSALRFTPSPLHFSIDEAIDFAKQLKAERVWLTHISHELDHQQTNAYLPPNIRLAYDGLEIEF